VLEASAIGDNEAWRDLHDAKTSINFPGGESIELFGPSEWVLDDFDGDGITSFADDLQARQALHGPSGQSMSWECTATSDTETECRVTAIDAFMERGGSGPIVSISRFATLDGLVTGETFLEPPDPAAIDAANQAWFQEIVKYEQWLNQTHPGDYESAFHGPCCDSPMVMLPSGIAVHANLMPEYLEATK
jgi:hypothetical protein